jgi:hypothetical protein
MNKAEIICRVEEIIESLPKEKIALVSPEESDLLENRNEPMVFIGMEDDIQNMRRK